jgi:hypothetical protein
VIDVAFGCGVCVYMHAQVACSPMCMCMSTRVFIGRFHVCVYTHAHMAESECAVLIDKVSADQDNTTG